MSPARTVLTFAATALLVASAFAQTKTEHLRSSLPLSVLPHYFREALLTESEAILLERPELASPGETMSVIWSPTGRYLLSLRQEQSIRQQLSIPRTPPPTIFTIWNGSTGKYRDVYIAPPGRPLVPDVAWLPDTNVLLAIVQPGTAPASKDAPASGPPPEPALIHIDARTGRVRTLAKVPEGTSIEIHPDRPLAVIMRSDWKLLWLADAKGSIRDLAPKLRNLPWQWVRWVKGGTQLEIAVSTPEQKGLLFHRMDPDTGEVTGPQRNPSPASLAPSLMARIEAVLQPPPPVTDEAAARDVPFPQPRPLLLAPGDNPAQTWAIVAENARLGEVSPNQDAVYYVSGEGAVWVRRFLRMDRAVYHATRTQEERNVILIRAKQLGVAIAMYTVDHDQTLPGSQQNVPALLRPYMHTRHERFLASLVYTHPGGSLGNIPRPAETELGYIPAPGGRAVIFVDGHVKFVPDAN